MDATNIIFAIISILIIAFNTYVFLQRLQRPPKKTSRVKRI